MLRCFLYLRVYCWVQALIRSVSCNRAGCFYLKEIFFRYSCSFSNIVMNYFRKANNYFGSNLILIDLNKKKIKNKMNQKVTVTEAALSIFPEVKSNLKLSTTRLEASGSMHSKSSSQFSCLNARLNQGTSFGNNVIRNKLIQLDKLDKSPNKFNQKINSQNLRVLNNALVQDVQDKQNKYLTQKAKLFAKKAYDSISFPEQRNINNLGSYINKQKSYISRIDRLYRKQQRRYDKMITQIRVKHANRYNLIANQ